MERVAQLREEGRTIYVDFTARWCATRQTNKQLVFGSRECNGIFTIMMSRCSTRTGPTATRGASAMEPQRGAV